MKPAHATLAVVAAAMIVIPVAAGTAAGPKQLIAIASKANVDRFVLTPVGPGAIEPDTGRIDWCCWSRRSRFRDGQTIEINDPLARFTGKRGTLVVRFRIEWLDAGNGYTIGVSTWRIVEGTGAYEHVTGHGHGAQSWLPRGPVSFLAEGFVISK